MRFQGDGRVEIIRTEREVEPEPLDEDCAPRDRLDAPKNVAKELTRALFRLGLLTDEVEERLGTPLGDHDKTVQAGAFEQWLSHEFTDWKAESEKVAAAFGVHGKFEFVQTIENGKIYPTYSASGVVDGLSNLRASYSPWGKQFLLRESGTNRCANISIWAFGKIFDTPTRLDYAPELAKGLYLLGLLNDEIEAALKVNITAHQKLEWSVEYDQHYDL